MVGTNLIRFPTKAEAAVPIPVYARFGEVFPYIIIEDHSYEHIGIFPGCVMVFCAGKFRERLLHLIRTEKGPALAWLTMKNMFDVRVQSASPCLLTSGVYKLKELDVCCEVERWPSGLTGSRVVYLDPERALGSRVNLSERPLLIASN